MQEYTEDKHGEALRKYEEKGRKTMTTKKEKKKGTREDKLKRFFLRISREEFEKRKARN